MALVHGLRKVQLHLSEERLPVLRHLVVQLLVDEDVFVALLVDQVDDVRVVVDESLL